FLSIDLRGTMLADIAGFGPCWIGADQDQPGVAATRQAEESNPFAIDGGVELRCAEHEIDQALDVLRPLDISGQVARTAPIQGVVAGMTEGSEDKTRVGERFAGAVMDGKEVGAPAVRDDDQRQLVAEQRTILHAPQSEIIDMNLSRRFGAGRPD